MRISSCSLLSTGCYKAGNGRTEIPHIDNLSLYSLVSCYAGRGKPIFGGGSLAEDPAHKRAARRAYEPDAFAILLSSGPLSSIGMLRQPNLVPF
jgi:hypothetical protein